LDEKGSHVGQDEEEGDSVGLDGSEVAVAREVGHDPTEEDVVACMVQRDRVNGVGRDVHVKDYM